MYRESEGLYSVISTITNNFNWGFSNTRPTMEQPALVPVIPIVPLQDIACSELRHLSEQKEWDSSEEKPVLSLDLVKKNS